MFRRINHFYRHCPHCRTGILILVTILLITAVNLTVNYTPELFFGRLSLNSKIPPHPTLGKGTRKVQREDFPPINIAVGRKDIFTGERSVGFHFCEYAPACDEFQSDWKQNEQVRRFKKAFKLFSVDNGFDYVLLQRPQGKEGDVLEVDPWATFIVSALKQFLNKNTNVLFLTAHGSEDWIQVMGDWRNPSDPRIPDFVEAVKSKVLKRITNDSELVQILTGEMGYTNFGELFGTSKESMSLTTSFFSRIILERRADVFLGLSCNARDVYLANKFQLGYQDCPNGVAAMADFQLFLTRLLNYWPGDYERSVLAACQPGSSDICLRGYLTKLSLNIRSNQNYTFSPAPTVYSYACFANKAGVYDHVSIGTWFDTTMDTNTGRLTVNIKSGNLKITKAPHWNDPNQFDMALACDGKPCLGKISIDEAYGIGDIIDGESVSNHLNGNQVPPTGDWGYGENYFPNDLNSHDPFVEEIDCAKYGGEKHTVTDPERTPRAGKITPPPPPVGQCGNGIIDPGEQCEKDSDCPPPEEICGLTVPYFCNAQCTCELSEVTCPEPKSPKPPT